MFDFEKLEVYKKAKDLNTQTQLYLKSERAIDSYIRDQLHRASISIVINIAEGSGKFSKADKRNFYTIARGSVYESVALLEMLSDEGKLSAEVFKQLYGKYEILSKMIYGLIESQK